MFYQLYFKKIDFFLTKVQLPNFFYIIATIIKAYWTAMKTPFNWICFARVILNMMKLFLFFSCVEKQTNKKKRNSSGALSQHSWQHSHNAFIL